MDHFKNIQNKTGVKMYYSENPIDKLTDDLLERKTFSKHLANSILNWKDKESIVIGLLGKWGLGKTSLLNLTIDSMTQEEKQKLEIIKFNPWSLSESDNLLENFIAEITSTLNKNKVKNKKLINKLEYYSQLLSLTTHSEKNNELSSSIIALFGFLGVSASQFNWFGFSDNELIKTIIFWISMIGLGASVILILIKRVLSLLKLRNNYFKKSVTDTKNEIIDLLSKSKKKLLIIIDDIDRLSSKEIKQIFRIIRTNTDFPNTIYLCAFDRTVIEKNLEEQPGINGSDYLEKIIQVNFTLPLTSRNQLNNYLLKLLDEVILEYPSSVQEFFEKTQYWTRIFQAGFNHYFESIRDIKRYINVLNFNFTQVINKGNIEVNPIDFCVIEAIRLFEPTFYEFMKVNNQLFTYIKPFSTNYNNNDESSRRDLLMEKLNEVNKPEILKELLSIMFPQIKAFLNGESNTSYSGGYSDDWIYELRICTSDAFDTYFNFLPGGDIDKISYYEIVIFSNSLENHKELTRCLDFYRKNNRLPIFLDKVEKFIGDSNLFKLEHAKNFVLALFDIHQNLPEYETPFFGYGLDVSILRIIFNYLKKSKDLEFRYEVLKYCTVRTKSLYGALHTIATEIQSIDKKKEPELIPVEKLNEIKQICITKILEKKQNLLSDENFQYILFRWKQWSTDNELQLYLSKILDNNKLLISFLKHFKTTSRSSDGETIRKHYKINFDNLKSFFDDLTIIEDKVKIIKNSEDELANAEMEFIDYFLVKYENKDKVDDPWEEYDPV